MPVAGSNAAPQGAMGWAAQCLAVSRATLTYASGLGACEPEPPCGRPRLGEGSWPGSGQRQRVGMGC